jgi:hypothetical protein
MTTLEQIEKLAGRKVDFKEVNYKGVKGFLPVYINFNMQSRLSELFAVTQEEAADKFLTFLKGLGDTDDDSGRADVPSTQS